MMADDNYEVSYLRSGRTRLHWAVFRDDIEQLKIFLQNGDDPNTQDIVGNSPLHYLSSHNSEMIETLFNHGANVNFKNNYDRTPLHALVSNKDPCVKDARLKSVKMLLEKGANVNIQDCKGSTPLHDLVRCTEHDDWHPSDDGICDLLLGYGTNVQLQDLDGCTPLHLAPLRLTFKLQKNTYGKSAVNIPDKSGDYPLHTVIFYQNLMELHLLLDNGARVNCKNGNGQTPLHLTILYFTRMRFMCKEFGKSLLQRGADVNSQDNKGRTSLDYAAKQCVRYCKKYEFCRSSPLHKYIDILLDWGASFSFRNPSWKSRSDPTPFFENKKMYEIRKTCLGLPPNITKQMSSVHEFRRYEKDCRTEVNKMKAERHGNISLHDIFQQQFDPLFLLNEGLVSKLQSTNLEDDYPYYASLLTVTYHRSKERVKLFDSVSTILQTPLPLEMIRYIPSWITRV